MTPKHFSVFMFECIINKIVVVFLSVKNDNFSVKFSKNLEFLIFKMFSLVSSDRNMGNIRKVKLTAVLPN